MWSFSLGGSAGWEAAASEALCAGGETFPIAAGNDAVDSAADALR